MSSVYASLSFSFLERAALVFLAFISYVLVARLLTPEEIGIYSVAAALIAIGQVMREFGVGNFLIQEEHLTKEHIRTAFGVSLLIGAVLFVAFGAGAPLVARFYSDDRMILIVRIIAVNFLLLPFCSISLALLRRNMQFRHLMSVNVSAALAGTVVTLGMAWGGYGPQSLAWGIVVLNAVTGIGAALAMEGREAFRPSLSEWRKVLKFGGQSASVAVVTTVAMDINDLVVGRVLGFAPVAIFSRAFGVVNLFQQQVMGAIRNVALPAFALAHREKQALEPRYVDSVAAVTAIAWPFYGFIAMHPQEILRILFGPQWDAAAPLVPILALSGALAALCNLVLTLAIAIGRNDVATRTDLLVQPIRATIVIAAALIFRSLEAIAWATLAAYVLATPYFLLVKHRLIPTDLAAMRHGLTASLVLTAACLVLPGASLVLVFGAEGANTLGTFVHAALAAMVWILGIFWLKHPLSRDALVARVTDNLISAVPAFGALLPRRAPKSEPSRSKV